MGRLAGSFERSSEILDREENLKDEGGRVGVRKEDEEKERRWNGSIQDEKKRKEYEG